jgi:hypothetical protein
MRVILVTIFSLILLRMRNISDKSCRENQNTHFMIHNFFSENRTVFEITWKNMAELERRQMTEIIWRIRVAYYISKSTRTHWPGHQQTRAHKQMCNIYCFSTPTVIRESVSLSRYTCIVYLLKMTSLLMCVAPCIFVYDYNYLHQCLYHLLV